MKKVIAALILLGFITIGISSCSNRIGCPGMSDSYKYSGKSKGVWR